MQIYYNIFSGGSLLPGHTVYKMGNTSWIYSMPLNRIFELSFYLVGKTDNIAR